MKKSASSKRWLQRQESDPFVKQARLEGYRSRAAFKLLEIEARFHLLRNATCVVDLGAAPGSWSQVVAEKCRTKGIFLALDLLPMQPVERISSLQGDFREESTVRKLGSLLGERLADVILSDLAPNTTGHARTDHLKNLALVEEAYVFAQVHLAYGGIFVAKVFQGGTERRLLSQIKQEFEKVSHMKPRASRPESREVYLIATGFRRNAAAAFEAPPSICRR